MNKSGGNSLRTALVVLACFSAISHAQQKPQLPGGYPTKPIRLIVGTVPGGGINNLSRAVAQELSERWDASVVVDNRGGARGVIAMNLMAQAAPDGYTIYCATQSMILNAVTNKLPYDIRIVYVPVVKMASQPYILLVSPSLPVNSLKELIAYAKSKPGALNYGASGLMIHFGTELFKSMAGVDVVHVPYKGTGPIYLDLIGGRIQLLISGTLGGAPFVKSGKLKAIGVTSLKRVSAYPDLPTFDESGLRGFELNNSSVLYAPSGISPSILLALNQEISRIVNSPEMKERLAADGSEAAAPATPTELKKLFVMDVNKWEKLVKTSGLTLD